MFGRDASMPPMAYSNIFLYYIVSVLFTTINKLLSWMKAENRNYNIVARSMDCCSVK